MKLNISAHNSHAKRGVQRVVFVQDHKDDTVYSGMHAYMVKLLAHLDRTRYLPSVLVSGLTDRWHAAPQRFLDELKRLDVPVLQPPDPGHVRGLSAVREIYDMATIFAKGAIDVVHIHTGGAEKARKITIAARLGGVPVLVRTEHLPPTAWGTPKSRYRVKPFDWLTDRIISVSLANLREQQTFLGRSPTKLMHAYIGPDLTQIPTDYDANTAKRSLDLPVDRPCIGVVGRLTEQKGIAYFLDAAARTITSIGPATFLIVGDGDLRCDLEQQAKRLGIASSVCFAGWQTDTMPYIAAMDVAVMASLYEGFPLTLLDFMAMRKPIVATSVDGNTEAIQDGVSGLLVPSRDADALADGLIRVLTDRALAMRLAANAYDRVQTSFSVERLADDTVALYDALLKENNCWE